MTEESERNATGWLSYLASQGSAEAITLQSMLARPTLPELPVSVRDGLEKALAWHRKAFGETKNYYTPLSDDAQRNWPILISAAVRLLEATAPKTKTEFRVTWAGLDTTTTSVYATLADAAEAIADSARRQDRRDHVVTITPLKVQA